MSIGVIGGGSFGTGLAAVFAQSSKDVMLWMRDQDAAEAINAQHRNLKRLPSVELPENLIATHQLDNLSQASVLLLVLPAQQTRIWLDENIKALPDVPMVCCAKGIDRETGLFQTQIVEQAGAKSAIGALSGPGFAGEIAAGLPTAMTLAASDMDAAEDRKSVV